MFTIKWVVQHADGEVIRMFQSNEVVVACRNGAPAAVDAPVPAPWKVAGRYVERALLAMDNGDLSAPSLDCGTVYVMNEEGATVGKYFLGNEPADRAVVNHPGVAPPAPNPLAA